MSNYHSQYICLCNFVYQCSRTCSRTSKGRKVMFWFCALSRAGRTIRTFIFCQNSGRILSSALILVIFLNMFWSECATKVKDEAQAHNSKCTWPHVLVTAVKDAIQAHGPKYTQSPVFQIDLFEADGYTLGMIDDYMPMKTNDYAKGFPFLKIYCVTKSTASLFTVFGMLPPLPFDRGKMVSCLSMFCPHAVLLLILSKPYQVRLVHLSLPP